MKHQTEIADARTLAGIVQAARNGRLWIIGDVMLDEYVVGDAARISPEAPVPVVHAHTVESRLGGAANVARQAVALGASVTLAGIVGADEAGDEILSRCRCANIDTAFLMRDPARRSTRKLRIMARNHQMLRLDWEDIAPCSAAVAAALVEALSRDTPPHAVILSDYAKGMLTPTLIREVLAVCRQRGIAAIVDPKRRDYSDYRGCRVITPNLGELQLAAGTTLDARDIGSVAAASRRLIEAAALDAIVVTLSEHGMLVVERDKAHVHLPAATPHPVADTTGAGDTAIATLTASLAAGATLLQAAQIANLAAGISVSRVGAVAVSAAELIAELNGPQPPAIVDRTALAAKVDTWRAAGQRIVFTNGCFDLLHAGHLSLLHRAASRGDRLILAINSDASVRRLKGPARPVISQDERAAMLAALACVDAVTVFDEDTPMELVRLLRPDVLVKGGDYRAKDIVGRDFIVAYGGCVEVVPLVPEKSTTALIERITRAQHCP